MRAFLDFLEQKATRVDELYILGDFFEVWVGDDDDSSFLHEIKAHLQHLSNRGTRIYVMHGNRDFLIGRRFCRQTGAVLLKDPTVINLNGEPVLLMHGDSLCTDDFAYQKFRRKMRHPLAKMALNLLPLKKRKQIAADLRKKSREHNANKPDYIMDVNSAEVKDVMREHQVRTLIHGHTHRPDIHEFKVDGKNSQRIVLQDWHDTLGWLEVVHDGEQNFYELKSEPII